MRVGCCQALLRLVSESCVEVSPRFLHAGGLHALLLLLHHEAAGVHHSKLATSLVTLLNFVLDACSPEAQVCVGGGGGGGRWEAPVCGGGRGEAACSDQGMCVCVGGGGGLTSWSTWRPRTQS